ncbi:MAG: prepilin-type N-terminal cleavage/methylation domain-containing protein [Candidatus Pacebacteria bacterium]|nr:prepilin-type N-terminal cleavage/methylation domain-containing protein [Candidatus Paceibacterota bacterium]
MKKKFIQKKRRTVSQERAKASQGGFTLVETLVAIAIFSMSILGLLSVMATGITNTTYAKNKMIAGYLAQEGIEYIRNLRDDYVFYDSQSPSTLGWVNFENKTIGGSMGNTICASSNECTFDSTGVIVNSPSNWPMNNLSIHTCSVSNCASGAINGILYYHSATGSYYSSSSPIAGDSPSGFIRQIQMTPISPNEIEVSAIVYWKQGTKNFSTTLSENLFDWY